MTTLHSVRHRVEYTDTDAVGGMYFTRYASLIETAATMNLEALGVDTHLARESANLVVSELHMRYLATARVRDLLLTRIRIDRVGGASCRISGEVRRIDEGAGGEGGVFAAGQLVMCLVRLEGGAPIALPGPLRVALRACMEDRDG